MAREKGGWRVRRVLFQIFVSVSIAISAGSVAAKYDGRVLDAHAHVPRGVSVDFILKQYAKAGVDSAMLFVKIRDAGPLRGRLPAGFPVRRRL